MNISTFNRGVFQSKIRPYFVKEYCEECGTKESLHLHHSDKYFATLLEETLIMLGLDHKSDTEFYNEKDLEMIKLIMLGKQVDVKYKTLCETCHIKEHKKKVHVKTKKISHLKKSYKSISYSEEIKNLKIMNTNKAFLQTPIALPLFYHKKKSTSERKQRFKIDNRVVEITINNTNGKIPNMIDLNVILALFSLSKSNNKINFTFAKISKILGYAQLGGALLKLLTNSLFRLYNSKIDIRIFEGEKIVHSFSGSIINEVKIVDTDLVKKTSPYNMEKLQYIVIDEYFYNSLKEVFSKININTFNNLKNAFSKKMYLSLDFKNGFLEYNKLFPYIGISITTPKERSYAIYYLKLALNELLENNIISDYNETKGIGVYISFE